MALCKPQVATTQHPAWEGSRRRGSKKGEGNEGWVQVGQRCGWKEIWVGKAGGKRGWRWLKGRLEKEEGGQVEDGAVRNTKVEGI